jgi:hypothetical protein
MGVLHLELPDVPYTHNYMRLFLISLSCFIFMAKSVRTCNCPILKFPSYIAFKHIKTLLICHIKVTFLVPKRGMGRENRGY